ncbi:MAG: acetate kinase [bacterium]
MKILVINCGSSSIKYQLFEMTDETVVAKGIAERIGLPIGFIKLSIPLNKKKIQQDVSGLSTHEMALEKIIKLLVDENVIRDKKEIKAIGHRLVHAGEFYSDSVKITDDVIEKMESCNELAPLHNPHNITGVRTTEKLFPNCFQAGCFDTAFHQTMPDYAYMYPIDYKYYHEFKVRRYGFHGTSHKYVTDRAAKMLKRDKENLKIITCHLGNGASLAAVKNGKSVDTSMGMTPLEGIMMGTRSGDIDPALVFFITEKDGISLDAYNKMLNKGSGLKGVSGVNNDMRDLWGAIEKGNERARLAVDMFVYRLKKYIGAYAAAMGGVDAIVFTGGIGENDEMVRKMSMEGMGFLGCRLNEKKNMEKPGKDGLLISQENSEVAIMVIPTNEELVIARETQKLYDIEQ